MTQTIKGKGVGNDSKKAQITQVIETLYGVHSRRRMNIAICWIDHLNITNVIRSHNRICEKVFVGIPKQLRSYSKKIQYQEISYDEELPEIALKIMQREFYIVASSYKSLFNLQGEISTEEIVQAFNIDFNRLFTQDKTDGNYTLYATMQKAYRSRVIDLIRQIKGDKKHNKQRYFEYTLMKLDAMDASTMEAQLPDNLLGIPEDSSNVNAFFESIIYSKELSFDEKAVIHTLIITNGGVSDREIDRMTGINHKRVRRIIRNIRPKIAKLI